MNPRKNMLKAVLLCAVMTGGLSGCASIVAGGGTPSRYTIAPVNYTSAAPDQLKVRLIIADPDSEAAFSTSKITRSPEPLRYDYYADGEWTDRAPRLFGIFLERSFENTGKIEAVGDRATLPIGDYILDTDIRSFHIEMRDGQNVALISYHARLSDRRSKTIASQLFTASEPVSNGSLLGAVEAFNRAANRAGDATVTWTLDQIVGEMQGGDRD